MNYIHEYVSWVTGEYWSVLAGIGIITGISFVVAVVIASVEPPQLEEGDIDSIIRFVSGVIVAALAWPVALAALAPAVAGAILFFVGRSWIRLIPSKAERIAKRESRVTQLRGEVDSVRRSA